MVKQHIPTVWPEPVRMCTAHYPWSISHTLVPRVFVPLDQRSWNKQTWKNPIWSPKIADFRLSCACPAWMNDQRTSWNFTSCHFSFKLITIDPVTELSRVARTVRNEDSRYETVAAIDSCFGLVGPHQHGIARRMGLTQDHRSRRLPQSRTQRLL